MKFKTKDIYVSIDAFHKGNFKKLVADFVGVDVEKIDAVSIYKKSVDARRKNNVRYVVSFVFDAKCNLQNNDKVLPVKEKTDFFELVKSVQSDKKIMIVGSGCAGLFCALYLAKCGLNPILIEQGKPVAERQKDVDDLWQNGNLNLQSNVQFGLGGAGTFSDGKLTTSAHNEYVDTIFLQLAKYGAPEEILYEAMPHIGTDNLKTVVSNIAKEIEACGGKILYNTKLIDIKISDGIVSSAVVQCGISSTEIAVDYLILAIGHSARDTFEMLLKRGMNIIQKPFSVGVRIEHKREMINSAQYGKDYDKRLPAATYKMSAHLPDGRSVYTFCMCPGGEVVLSCSEKNSIVTNGMSRFARDEENSNSAVLVGVTPQDFSSDAPLAGVEFQRKIERAAYEISGKYSAPAQNVKDFMQGKKSSNFHDVKPSVKPCATPADLTKCLPDFVIKSIKSALPIFGKSIYGFDKEGVLVGVETRSSSPVKLVRNENFASNIVNIFPCGEGSGYAGGIVTAAVDGVKCAMKIADHIKLVEI